MSDHIDVNTLGIHHTCLPTGVCVFITAGPITKLFAGGVGGEWRTCAMIAYPYAQTHIRHKT